MNPISRLCAGVLILSGQVLAGTPPARKPLINVVLVTIDTVRADHVGCYGAGNVQTPALDSLARDGIVFDNAIAQVPLTWPSHAVILTGMYPFQNGVQDFTGQPLDKRLRTVAQAFKQRGYATGAVVSAFVLDQSWGLARGFDFYDDAFSPEDYSQRNKNLGMVERPAGVSVDHALNWLKKTSRRPFFFWLHLYDPHSPYDPPEPYRTQYSSRPYDGEIAYADHELGRLITWLKRNRLYERSLVVVLSDHGESLGEHGEKEHGFFVYNATVRIPLIVKPPAGSGFRPAHVARPVETAAVAPTLVHLAGLKDPVQAQFHSPDLLVSATENDSVAYSETFYPFNSFGWSPLHSVETGRYQYIDAPEPELYDVKADPEEKNNLAAQQPATVAVLKDKLQALLRTRPFTPSQGEGPPLAPDALEKLQALGYVAYHSSVPAGVLAGSLPDPKDKLWEFQTILAAEDALHAGDVATGQALLAQVREKDPKMYIVPFYLGESALSQRNWDEASTQFKKCLELNPNFEQAMTGLSRALIYRGELDEARVWVERVLKINPRSSQAWYALAVIESHGDKKASIAAYEKAISLQGNFAPLHRDLGLLQFEQHDYTEAAKHLSKAVDLGVSDAIVFYSLGMSYSRTQQLPKAVESYKKALELNPRLAEAHVNLAYAYQGMNRTELAKQEFEAACKLEDRFCDLVPGSKQ
ncbi:MAG: sulfatase-like hydrolase/transferase [Acidobacteriia bacterium]|nr:sulfatase-like hydrolase/transferase [Terriglobia bacterium]